MIMTPLDDKEQRFPEKLFDVANENKVICWNENGDSISISEKKFEENIMVAHPGLVKIPQFANFRRLMREYAFQWQIVNDNNDLTLEFSHPFFIRGQKDLLNNILTKRKSRRLRKPAKTKINKCQATQHLDKMQRRKHRGYRRKDKLESVRRNDSMRNVKEIRTQGLGGGKSELQEHGDAIVPSSRFCDNHHAIIPSLDSYNGKYTGTTDERHRSTLGPYKNEVRPSHLDFYNQNRSTHSECPKNLPKSNYTRRDHDFYQQGQRRDMNPARPTKNLDFMRDHDDHSKLGVGDESFSDQPVSQVSFEDFEKLVTIYPQFFDPNLFCDDAQQKEDYELKWTDVPDMSQQATITHDRPTDLVDLDLTKQNPQNDDHFHIPRNVDQRACGRCRCCMFFLAATYP